MQGAYAAAFLWWWWCGGMVGGGGLFESVCIFLRKILLENREERNN